MGSASFHSGHRSKSGITASGSVKTSVCKSAMLHSCITPCHRCQRNVCHSGSSLRICCLSMTTVVNSSSGWVGGTVLLLIATSRLNLIKYTITWIDIHLQARFSPTQSVFPSEWISWWPGWQSARQDISHSNSDAVACQSSTRKWIENARKQGTVDYLIMHDLTMHKTSLCIAKLTPQARAQWIMHGMWYWIIDSTI